MQSVGEIQSAFGAIESETHGFGGADGHTRRPAKPPQFANDHVTRQLIRVPNNPFRFQNYGHGREDLVLADNLQRTLRERLVIAGSENDPPVKLFPRAMSVVPFWAFPPCTTPNHSSESY